MIGIKTFISEHLIQRIHSENLALFRKKSANYYANESIKFISKRDPGLKIPLVFKTLSGKEILEYNHEGNLYYIRLLHFIHGNFMKDQKKNKNSLLNIGSFLARLDIALDGFDHERHRGSFLGIYLKMDFLLSMVNI